MEAKSTMEVKAEVEMWQYVFGFTPTAVIKCAIELKIPDILESHGGAMSLSDLSSAAGCSPSALRRIMRYLVHRGIFKQVEESTSSISYAQTRLSRLLLQNINDSTNSMASLVLLECNPVMLAPMHKLSSRALIDGPPAPSDAGIWEYMSQNPAFNKLFYDALAYQARRGVSDILDHCPEVFEGIGCLVDVGGGDGTSLRAVVKAFPGIRGINFDLPHVVAAAPRHDGDGVEHVGGDMFQQVPKGDAVFMMRVLHSWSDEKSIEILKKCKEAVPKETGKVIIVEAVIVQGEEDKYDGVNLAIDMLMLAHTNTGKERTIEEWEYVVYGAGFSSYKVKHIGSATSLIEAYL